MFRKSFMWALFSVVFVAFVGCGGSHSSPESAAEEFVKLMVDNKVPEIMKEVRTADGKPFSGDESEAMGGKISMSIMGLKMQGEVASIKAQEVEYNSDKTAARVPVKIEFKNGKDDIIPAEVKLFDGKWYVVLELPGFDY